VEHLRESDAVMRSLVEQHGAISLTQFRRDRPTDPYGALIRAIVGQQLSTIAARAIYGRVLELFGGVVPTPRALLDVDEGALRKAGLSRAKVAYLRDLAERVDDGRLQLDRLPNLSDDEVSAELTAVKGIGQWSADMFLMFQLGRKDVLPVGDLGIRRAVERLYDLPKIPDAPTVLNIGEPWRPYRSLASLYLWTSGANTPV
jgi:DNA-3-methyladenine glycosylase II